MLGGEIQKPVSPFQTLRLGFSRSGLLTLAILAAISLVLMMGLRVSERMAALQAAPQDNVQWSLAQLDVELLAAGLAAGEAATGDDAALKQFRQRFDVFYSRARTVAALPPFRQHLLTPETAANFKTIQTTLEELAGTVDSAAASLKDQLPTIRQKIEELRPASRQITLEGVRLYAAEADANRRDLAHLLWQTALVSTFLIIALGAALVGLGRQIIISRRRALEVQATNARNTSTVNASLDAIIAMTTDGRIVEFNPAAIQAFGCTRNAAIGQQFEKLIIPERFRPALRSGLNRLRHSGGDKSAGEDRIELAALKADGSEFPAEMSLAISHSLEGDIITAYLRDISKRKEQEMDLRRARDEALEASHVKGQFLAVMSHEMRTPLNGVMALLDLLRTTKLDERQSSYVQTAATSAEILRQHVDDVLDLTRMQAGRLELYPRVFNLMELLEEIQNLNTATAARRGNRIRLSVDMPEPFFLADRKRLHQVLTNLVGNAVKFTEGGEIEISASFSGVKADTVDVEFSVTDTGIGIPPEHQKRVFEDFVTLDSSLQRNASGAGLGLPICRDIVESMQGNIGVRSALGKGSTFWFRVPLKAAFAEQAIAAPRDSLPRPTTPYALNVLVVEDNETNRFVAQELLTSLGCNVSLANDGAAGVKLARDQRFDIIFMDISMPVMNGWDAARAIRIGEGNSQAARIFALTAYAMPDAPSLLQDSGMDGVLTKPLRRNDLLAALDQVQGRSEPAPAAAAFNQETIDEMIDLLGRARFDSHRQKFLAELSSGAKALKGHLARKETEKFGKLAHRMAGSASVFGALGLQRQLLAFEEGAMQKRLPRSIKRFESQLKSTAEHIRQL